MQDNPSDPVGSLSSGDPDRQVAALIELIKENDRSKIDLVLSLFTSSDIAVRSEAVRAAGFLGGASVDNVGPLLVGMLEDPDELVRTEAAEALTMIQFPPAVGPLTSHLRSDDSWIVRASAAEALGRYPGSSTAALFACADDDDELDEVRRYAIHSLGQTPINDSDNDMEALVNKLENDPDLGLQVRFAAYRTGDRSQIDAVKNAAATMSEFDASLVLNDIDAFLDYPRPPTLEADIPTIENIIDIIALRWPFERPHATKVRNRLSDVQGL
ncbi:HEAT repeat domain-containing protein [Nocardia fluminea]|uniref:HEAT repeat protein n=1 Tax=Nocardia fluminea TaxID=134984 RepID=A0A2N3VCK9_9NOCA|nr:HEAT repeat domain-containing protein [Nocardia fluminea]PKV79374.1 HEAT repeat protein [Nocardia fluminea]